MKKKNETAGSTERFNLFKSEPEHEQWCRNGLLFPEIYAYAIKSELNTILTTHYVLITHYFKFNAFIIIRLVDRRMQQPKCF